MPSSSQRNIKAFSKTVPPAQATKPHAEVTLEDEQLDEKMTVALLFSVIDVT